MKNLFLTSILLLSSSAFSGQGKEGGTPIRVRQNINNQSLNKVFSEIRSMITTGAVKKRAIYIIENVSDYKWKEIDISKSDLIQDIKASEYKIARKGESCIDKYGIARFATAKSNELGGDICFDLSKTYDNEHLIGHEELLAIVFHEHLHHFGIEDIDHKIGTKLALFGSYLPMNIIHGGCNSNLRGGVDSFNHRVYADDFGGDNFKDTDEWYLENFKIKAKKSISHIYKYSACTNGPVDFKLTCQTAFSKTSGNIESSDFICKAEAREGFMYITQDMLGFMNINFSRWD